MKSWQLFAHMVVVFVFVAAAAAAAAARHFHATSSFMQVPPGSDAEKRTARRWQEWTCRRRRSVNAAVGLASSCQQSTTHKYVSVAVRCSCILVTVIVVTVIVVIVAVVIVFVILVVVVTVMFIVPCSLLHLVRSPVMHIYVVMGVMSYECIYSLMSLVIASWCKAQHNKNKTTIMKQQQ